MEGGKEGIKKSVGWRDVKDTGWSQITEGEIQEENSGRSTGGEGSFLHLPLLLLPNILLLVLEEDAGDGLCFPANSIPPTFPALPCACSLPTAGQRLGLAGTARGDTQHLLEPLAPPWGLGRGNPSAEPGTAGASPEASERLSLEAAAA